MSVSLDKGPAWMMRIRAWQGAALAVWAGLLQRTVSGAGRRLAHKSARDRALRAASRRGVPLAVLATRVGLAQGTVRSILRGERTAA